MNAPLAPRRPPASGGHPEAPPDRCTGTPTDEAMIALWLRNRPSPHTREAYARDVAQALAWLCCPLAELTAQDLSAWQAHLQDGRALAVATVNRKTAALRSLLSEAHRLGYLAVNVGAVLRPLPQRRRLGERILAEPDVHRLLQVPLTGRQATRNRALLCFLYYTGARVAEALALQWQDVQGLDDAGGRPPAAALHGKGGRTRHVTLTPDVVRALHTLRPAAADPLCPVFATYTGRPLSRAAVWRLLRTAARKAGIEGPVSPHWLRHAHASHALARGAAVHVVQATLGHASLATTTQYVHVRPGASSGHSLARLAQDPVPT